MKCRYIRNIVLTTVLLTALLAIAFARNSNVALTQAPKDNIPIYNIKTAGRQIALTLDVAWGSNMTDRQLDIFDQYHMKATFYVTGRWAENNPAELQKIAVRGHEIGSHGHAHLDFTKLSEADMRKELEQSSEAIYRITGKKPATFRAPYGAWNAKAVDVVCGQQYDFVQWDVDSLDWKGLTPSAMEARVIPSVKAGSILLFHNNGQHTTEALPAIIDQLQKKGFEFVTISELIGETLEVGKSD